MNPTHKPTSGAVTDATPAELMRAAASYLREHGWIQLRYFADSTSPTPPACACGAIAYAIYGYPTNNPLGEPTPLRYLYWRTVNVLGEYLLGQPDAADSDSGIGFNDTTGRTAEQVIAALDAAADDWDRTHGGAK